MNPEPDAPTLQHARGYADAWGSYAAKGWCPLPLPQGQKKPPPDDVTGYDGRMAEEADFRAWARVNPLGNLGLRLPPGVIGIDVDDYDDKQGARTLRRLEELHGALPATFTSSSRGAGLSSVRFYRIPPGRKIRSELRAAHLNGSQTKDIELISVHIRYVVTCPSTHPDTGLPYLWRDLNGGVTYSPPAPEELPWLPESWLEIVTDDGTRPRRGGPLEGGVTASSLEPDGIACPTVQRAVSQALAAYSRGRRHEAMLASQLPMLDLATFGHRGVRTGLLAMRDGYVTAVADRAPLWEASGEFDRALEPLLHAISTFFDKPVPNPICRCEIDVLRALTRQATGFTAGTGGINERLIMNRFLDLAEQTGTRRLRESEGNLAVEVKVSQPAAHNTLVRLRRLGWLRKVQDPSAGRGTTYEIQPPRDTDVLVLQDPREGGKLGSGREMTNTSLSPTAHDLFSVRGLPKGSAETLLQLPSIGLRLPGTHLIAYRTWSRAPFEEPPVESDGQPASGRGRRSTRVEQNRPEPLTPAQIAKRSGKALRTVQRHLKALRTSRLVAGGSRWGRLDFNPDDVAAELEIRDTGPWRRKNQRLARLCYYAQQARHIEDGRPARFRYVPGLEGPSTLIVRKSGHVLFSAEDEQEEKLLAQWFDDLYTEALGGTTAALADDQPDPVEPVGLVAPSEGELAEVSEEDSVMSHAEITAWLKEAEAEQARAVIDPDPVAGFEWLPDEGQSGPDAAGPSTEGDQPALEEPGP